MNIPLLSMKKNKKDKAENLVNMRKKVELQKKG